MSKDPICLLNDSFPPEIDGVANAVVNYARQLNAEGHDAFVVTPEYPGADDSGFDFPVIRYPGLDARESVGYMVGIPFAPQVLEAVKQRGAELLHSHCPIASTALARSLRRTLDVPLVMTYHTKFDIDIANAVKGKLLQDSAIAALVSNISGCDEVWVVSEGAGENLRSLGYQGDYIVMENGVDVPKRRLPEDRVMELTKDHALPTDVPVFLFVGRLMWYKGLRIIIDALAALRSQEIDFRMVFVGSGADSEEVKAYVTSLGLDDKIIFTGAVYDREALCAWYCRADLFLFPSTFDTNGLVVREAAACSLASVLIKGSCAAEGVTNRQNGFLIEENAASLAVMLARFAGDREMLRRVGQNAADQLYISWADAVSKASERYAVVIDNYKSGVYARRSGAAEDIFDLSGDLMKYFAESEKKRQETLKKIKTLKTRINELADSFERYL
jgi:glycosyltransferase involved in cell wall biosynthesis